VKAGDNLSIGNDDSYLYSHLYAECLAYDLVPYIEYAPLTKSYFCTLVSVGDAAPHVLARTIAMAVMNQVETFIFTIPTHIDADSLICAVKRNMEKHNHRIEYSYDGFALHARKVDGWNDLVIEIKSIPELNDLPEGEFYYTLSLKGFDVDKVRPVVYRVGKERGLNVKVIATETYLKVIYCSGKINKKIVKKTSQTKSTTPSASAQFRSMVNMIAWDVPFPFPDISDANLNKLLHEHPLPCLVRKGNTVTKRSLMVGKHDGKVAVLFKGEPVLVLDATHKTRLTARQKVQIEDTLAAYKDKV
jgi:hypothetical protein